MVDNNKNKCYTKDSQASDIKIVPYQFNILPVLFYL